MSASGPVSRQWAKHARRAGYSFTTEKLIKVCPRCGERLERPFARPPGRFVELMLMAHINSGECPGRRSDD